jgi:hypothetical protein
MTWKKGQSGNPKGRAKDKIWGDAIRIAVNEAYEDGDKKKLRVLADKLVDKALGGDIAALGKSVTGLDGKPAQAVEMSGEVAPRFVIHAPEVIHDSEEWQKKYAPKTVLTDTKNESEEA